MLKTQAAIDREEAGRLEAERPRREFEEKVKAEVARMLAADDAAQHETNKRGQEPQE
jgi:hypothetical protein